MESCRAGQQAHEDLCLLILLDNNFNISTGSMKSMGVKAGESITDLRVEVARVSIM